MNLKELHLADKWFKSSSYYIPNERSKKEQMTKYWEIQVCKLCRYGTYMDIDICFCSCLSHDQFISVFDECVFLWLLFIFKYNANIAWPPVWDVNV